MSNNNSSEKKNSGSDLLGTPLNNLVYYDHDRVIKEYEESERFWNDEAAAFIQESLGSEKAEELRRHNELVEVEQKQVELLAELLVDSKNAIEQRNAIIRFLVESMVASDQPKETKKKKLLEYSVQFASLAGGANDVMQIIDEAIKKMN